MKILIVDDDDIALNLLEMSLLNAGYDEIDRAQSGKEALRLIQEACSPYECMLLDIMMPEINGIELCQQVRKMPEYFGIPIIMITAVQDRETLETAMSVGATDYVHKPFDGIELGTRLRAATLLLEAVCRNGREVSAEIRQSNDTDSSILKLADAFSLDEKHGIVSTTRLWYHLIEKNVIPENIRLFSIALSGAQTIFESVPNFVFRKFVNEVAVSIAQTTREWSPCVSYIGNGTFIIALLNGQSFQMMTAKTVFKSRWAEWPCSSLALYNGRLRFCFEHVLDVETVGRTGADALCALLQAGTDARMAASDIRSIQQQYELRRRFLGNGDTKPVTTWETTWAKKPQKVSPKRVTPRNFRRRNNNGDACEAISEKNRTFKFPQYQFHDLSD